MMNKIKGHESAQARIYTDDIGTTALISYTTTVVVVDAEGWISVRGLYSATTRKHIGWFMRMFGETYQFAKQLYTDGKEYNLYTGEVRDVA